jgi:uncharacterized protein YaeQ
MSAKYTFHLQSQDRQRDLPHKIILGRQDTETTVHLVLKFLGYVLFYRERLQIEPKLDIAAIPFVPDLVQLDYQLRPQLWIECGECGVNKLHKLAVKASEAEIWIVKRSVPAAKHLLEAMEKGELRQGRYQIVALDAAMVEEMCGLLDPRNELLWVSGSWDPPHLQFDFNGLWFDATFSVLKF